MNPPSRKSRPLRYSGASLDRAHRLRDDADWLARAQTLDSSFIVPVWRDLSAVAGLPGADACVHRAPMALAGHAEELIFLGLWAETAVFAVDLSALERAQAEVLVGGGGFEDLRRLGPTLSHDEAALLAYARGIAWWHRNHRFCGRCGHPTVSGRAGHVRVCSNSGCAHTHFPRTDPAVIMLVEHPDHDGLGPRCLLGRSWRFPPGMYSTLAGFVEPGESLEDAVAREVFEESGIEVEDVRYLASQPWPFPSSMMIGFWTRARTTEIVLEDDELEDARWFSAEELLALKARGEDEKLCLPRADSIARFLIERWLRR
ncbi:MAG: NAD(+) diphosphatase [Wenzhouxiangellaceae bacterium]|nr:NAD(+) diphosphatase [Wenzhouxiangellaceae bacterium]